jgi:hypothetical protein
MVRETVPDKAQLALFDVCLVRILPVHTTRLLTLLDGVEGFLSSLALVHRGTSTIMLRMVLDSSAKRGMSLPVSGHL